MVNFTVIIPARYASSRFPGKCMVMIQGKPMVEHVYERAIESGAERVIIATDHDDIMQVAKQCGAEACFTSSLHESGTDRIAEAAQQLNLTDNDIIVNVQGDKPLIPPSLIRQVATALTEQTAAAMTTLVMPITSAQELFTTDAVKVVRDQNNFALYFSRAPIAWQRDDFSITSNSCAAKAISPDFHLHHIGIYGYRAEFLQQYVAWGACELELIEKLEQLRVLWHGYKIYAGNALEADLPGVDTPEDLERLLVYLKKKE